LCPLFAVRLRLDALGFPLLAHFLLLLLRGEPLLCLLCLKSFSAQALTSLLSLARRHAQPSPHRRPVASGVVDQGNGKTDRPNPL
jgi:hypothetical protein